MCIGSVTTVCSAAPNSAAPAIVLSSFPRTSIRSQGFCRRRAGEGQLVIALSRSPSFPGPSPGRMNKESDQLFALYINHLIDSRGWLRIASRGKNTPYNRRGESND
jgi:hypothetical protein